MDKWDFVLFFHDPDGRLDDEITITTVEPDIEYQKILGSKCLEFWEEVQTKMDEYGWMP